MPCLYIIFIPFTFVLPIVNYVLFSPMNNITPNIRVRFAPSPTGHLHIGGVRTALFNYLYARQLGGTYCLRIEDTDKERSTDANIQEIFSALDWLGLSPDEEPVLQSEHIQEHLDAVEKLLQEGNAYRCFCTKDEIDADKSKAKNEKRTYHYSGRCRDLGREEIRTKLNAGLPYTVRFRVPEGITRFKDMVYKDITVNNEEIDDFIILRSDGTPIYQLSVVIDDANMNITHVIRGEDHLSNTPKQILLYLALGRKVPKFGHLPLILAQDGKPLSKRHGATSVDEFKEMGFLPEGLLNGLALLGWGDNMPKPIFSLEELIERFDFSRVNKKGAIFDPDKLAWINGQHLSRTNAKDIWPYVKPLWQEKAWIDNGFSDENGIRYTDLLKSRIRLLNEFVDYGRYLFKDPLNFDHEAIIKHLQLPDIKGYITILSNSFESLKSTNAEEFETCLRQVAEKLDVKASVLIHSLRIAVTGFGVSPDIFKICEILGKRTVIKRLNFLKIFLVN
ncbi:MAG: glutamate--tRNA ligase [Candidatus Neomarinimicrobiota bacterium]|nr:MAG: glutamate--tRNA ligase [Candidatus Neomarinimicrobiota bacterium]